MAKSSAAFNIIFGAKTGQLTQALNTTQRKLQKASVQMQGIGKSLSRNLTLPLLAVGAGSLKLAVNFQSAMLKVKAISGATGKDFQELKKNALDLGKSTAFTAAQVASLQLEYAKAGFGKDQILAATAATLNLAQATGSDLALAAEVAATTIGQFGLDASETTRVTDVMAASFAGAPLDISRFQESMKMVGPIASKAGLSLEETTAMLMTLAQSGLHGSMAGTQLTRIISELGSTSGGVSEAIKKLASEGISLASAEDEVGKRAKTALLVLGDGIPTIEKFTKSLRDSEGAAQSQADTVNEGAEGGIKEMISALEGMAIVIGDALMPFLEKMVSVIKSVADGFARLSPTTQNIVVMFGVWAALLGPTMALIGGLGSKVLILVAMMKRKSAAMATDAVATGSAAVAQTGFAGATAAATVGLKAFRTALITTGIGALVVALGMVVGYMIDWISSTDDATDANAELNAEIEAGNKALNARADILKDATPNKDKSLKDLRATISALQSEVEGIDEGQVLDAFLKAKDTAGGAHGGDVINETLKNAILQLESLMSPDDMIKSLQGGKSFWMAEGADLLAKAVRGSRRDLQIEIEAAQKQIDKIQDQTKNKQPDVVDSEIDLQSIASVSKAYEDLAREISYFKRQAKAGDVIDVHHLSELESKFSKIERLAEQLGIDIDLLGAPEPLAPIKTDLKAIAELIPKADLTKGLKIDEAAFERMGAMMDAMAARAEKMQNVFDQAFSSMSGTMDEMAASGASAFDSLARSLAVAVRKIIAAQIAQAVSAAIMNAIKASGGNPFVGGILAASGAVAAKGIFERLIPAFATGGIVTKPTLSLIGEAGSEAIVPFNRMDEFIRMAGGGDGGSMSVAGRLAGGDIYLANQHANNQSGRRRAIV